MKWKKEHIFLLVIIAALAAYLVVHKSGRTHYVLPSVDRIEAKDITRLLIRNRDTVITLTKKGENWIVEPQGYPADKGIINSLLEDIGGLTLTALASEAGNEAVYELDAGHRIGVEAYQGDKLLRKAEIGKTAASGGHTFVELDGHPGIFHADNDLRSAFDKTVPDLRDKTVMKVDGDIASIILSKGVKTLKIEKSPPPVENAKKKAPGGHPEKQEVGPHWVAGKKPANDAQVDDLINNFSDLTCDSFVEGKEKKDFHAPLYTVSLRGAKTYALSIYRGKDKAYVAVSSESPYPFKLSEWKAKKIMKNFGSLTSSAR